jgi:uncharacterized protein
VPGPTIGFLQETVRWWDHWLKGRDTGIMAEPMLRLFMQDPAPPRAHYETRAGRWVAVPSWPSPNVVRTAFALGADGRLGTGASLLPGRPIAVRSPLEIGMAAGKWRSYAQPGISPPTGEPMTPAASSSTRRRSPSRWRSRRPGAGTRLLGRPPGGPGGGPAG